MTESNNAVMVPPHGPNKPSTPLRGISENLRWRFEAHKIKKHIIDFRLDELTELYHSSCYQQSRFLPPQRPSNRKQDPFVERHCKSVPLVELGMFSRRNRLSATLSPAMQGPSFQQPSLFVSLLSSHDKLLRQSDEHDVRLAYEFVDSAL